MINSLLLIIILFLVAAVLYYTFTTLFSKTKETSWTETHNLPVAQKTNNANDHTYFVTREALPAALEELGLSSKPSALSGFISGENFRITEHREVATYIKDGEKYKLHIMTQAELNQVSSSIKAPRIDTESTSPTFIPYVAPNATALRVNVL